MKGIPEPNRLIRLKCSDYLGDYECVGKWTNKGNRRSGRFMIQLGDGLFIVDRNTWLECESWEYLEESTPTEKLITEEEARHE